MSSDGAWVVAVVVLAIGRGLVAAGEELMRNAYGTGFVEPPHEAKR